MIYLSNISEIARISGAGELLGGELFCWTVSVDFA